MHNPINDTIGERGTMKLTVEAPEEWMVQHIADNMRDQDRVEIERSSGRDYKKVLFSSVEGSDEVHVVLVDGEPFGVFGIYTSCSLSMEGAIWYIGTDRIHDVYRQFLKASKRYVVERMKTFNVLYNYVDVDNTVSYRWLKWLGFEFEEPAPYGAQQKLFRRFSLCANQRQS